MLDGLWLEFRELFTRVYQYLDIRFLDTGISLDGGMYGDIAVGIVGLLAVSVPFVLVIKLINLVCGGVYK